MTSFVGLTPFFWVIPPGFLRSSAEAVRLGLEIFLLSSMCYIPLLFTAITLVKKQKRRVYTVNKIWKNLTFFRQTRKKQTGCMPSTLCVKKI